MYWMSSAASASGFRVWDSVSVLTVESGLVEGEPPLIPPTPCGQTFGPFAVAPV